MQQFTLIKRGLFSVFLLSFFACDKKNLEKEGSQPLFTSAYSHDMYSADQYRAQEFTSAPLRNVHMALFNQSLEKVYNTFLIEVEVFVPGLDKAEFDHSKSANANDFGVGSVRICLFDNGETVVEPFVIYEKNKFIGYYVDSERSTRWTPIRDSLLLWIFEEKSPNQTLVTLRSYYNPDLFFLMNWIVAPYYNKSIDGALLKSIDVLGGQLLEPKSWKP